MNCTTFCSSEQGLMNYTTFCSSEQGLMNCITFCSSEWGLMNYTTFCSSEWGLMNYTTFCSSEWGLMNCITFCSSERGLVNCTTFCSNAWQARPIKIVIIIALPQPAPIDWGDDRNYYNHSRTSEYSCSTFSNSLVTTVVSCNHSSHLSQEDLLPAIFSLSTQSMQVSKEWRECIHCPSQTFCSIFTIKFTREIQIWRSALLCTCYIANKNKNPSLLAPPLMPLHPHISPKTSA